MPQILHIVVNFTNDQETKEFVASCLKLSASEDVQFIIVNNSAKGADDKSFADFADFYGSRVRIKNAPENPGYFGAAQLAYKEYQREVLKFVIVSNSDLSILNTDFYLLLQKTEIEPDIGLLAPSVQSQLTGSETNPLYRYRPTRKKIKRLAFVYSNFYLAWVYHFVSWLKNLALSKFRDSLMSEKVYAAHGCFLILTQNYLSKGGDFSYPVKLYGEEVYLAEKLRQMDLSTLTVPDLKIYHREKGTELRGWSKRILSRRTFHFKHESAVFLASLFQD